MTVPKYRESEEAVSKWYVQQRSVNVRGLEIADAANKQARYMGIELIKASDGWLWRFRNRQGIGNKVERGESGCVDISAVQPFRLEFNRLLMKENLQLGQLYNANETTLFWRSLPRNIQAI